MKVVNLVFQNNRYNPVIHVGEDAKLEKSQKLIAEVHSSGAHVQIIGYTPPPEDEVIVISETDEEDLPTPEVTIESTPEDETIPVPVDGRWKIYLSFIWCHSSINPWLHSLDL